MISLSAFALYQYLIFYAPIPTCFYILWVLLELSFPQDSCSHFQRDFVGKLLLCVWVASMFKLILISPNVINCGTKHQYANISTQKSSSSVPASHDLQHFPNPSMDQADYIFSFLPSFHHCIPISTIYYPLFIPCVCNLDFLVIESFWV